ncbi:hypothetical protein BH09VER1_BH09VER1_24840 [soil metagenome]
MISAWKKVEEALPDADLTVMGFNATWSEPVWPCYLDGEVWSDTDGGSLDGDTDGPDPRPPAPTHWMDFPECPITTEPARGRSGELIIDEFKLNEAISLLNAHGFRVVSETAPLEKAATIRRRICPHLNSTDVSKRLASRHCPPFTAERSASGRILRLRLNPELEAFLRQPHQNSTARKAL